MTDQSPPENSTAPKKSEWMDLFRGGLAPYTVLLNLGIALHAIDIFVITTIMPTVVSDIGGISFYAWTSMLYMVGTIIGSAAGGYFRARMGTRGGYVWGGLILLVGTVACAIPPDMGTLLAARVVKGIGGGLVIAQSMALISDLYTPTIRTRILALISTTWTVASFLDRELAESLLSTITGEGHFGHKPRLLSPLLQCHGTSSPRKPIPSHMDNYHGAASSC